MSLPTGQRFLVTGGHSHVCALHKQLQNKLFLHYTMIVSLFTAVRAIKAFRDLFRFAALAYATINSSLIHFMQSLNDRIVKYSRIRSMTRSSSVLVVFEVRHLKIEAIIDTDHYYHIHRNEHIHLTNKRDPFTMTAGLPVNFALSATHGHTHFLQLQSRPSDFLAEHYC